MLRRVLGSVVAASIFMGCVFPAPAVASVSFDKPGHRKLVDGKKKKGLKKAAKAARKSLKKFAKKAGKGKKHAKGKIKV